MKYDMKFDLQWENDRCVKVKRGNKWSVLNYAVCVKVIKVYCQFLWSNRSRIKIPPDSVHVKLRFTQWLFKDMKFPKTNTSMSERDENIKKKNFQLSAITPEKRQLID